MPRQRERKVRRGIPWQVLEFHYRSRAAFNTTYRDYEARVQHFVEDRGVSRDKIRLTPGETTELFDTKKLEHLINDLVGSLRDAAHAFFRDSDVNDPYDSEVSKIWHELSILKEEHLSVRDFPREGNVRQFARLFREVSQYYPQRLRRVRDLFGRAQKRLDVLLPQFRDNVIVLRSAFLFRADLWPDSPQTSLLRLLGKIYPAEGPAFGFFEVARSFLKAAFYDQAIECARMGIATASKEAQARTTHAQHLRETISEMDRLVSRAEQERKALQDA
jgi:hypothetical protein